ncbi:MAG TPA: tetratricopeptide repeat protein [Thermoanaerobaculia bacterium]|nr:tetratricopeptide repeat protein [Thermoanaerobaculia bacterium]
MHRWMFSRLTVLVLPCLLFAACSGNSSANPNQVGSQLSFGVDMARHGLWSEALFRFQQAEQLEPQSPRVLNNLAVAYEATGEFEKALDYYKRALQISPNDRDVRANYSRFVEFYQGFRAQVQKPQAGPLATDTAPGAEAPGADPGPVLPLTPPGQAPVQPVTPPEGDTAVPPPDQQPSPPPPASS